MPEYRVKIVDAFTRERFAGNPCGVVTDAGGLSDAAMQQIAREINLSETAFVLPSSAADFQVRFFTPRLEIPLAGHPTIATMHALAEEGRIRVSPDGTRIRQELSIGILPVDLAYTPDRLVRIAMTQASPQFFGELDRDAVARALGIRADDLLSSPNPQVVSTGTRQAMVPVKSIGVLEKLLPDPVLLARLEQAGEYFSMHVFALDAYDSMNRVHSRHFAASAGIPEDPVTGSATGGMAAYLWRYGLLREPRYTVEQGHIMGRPGHVEVEVEADGDTPTVVRIAGTAVTVIEGTITV
jgi:trans-2,3-dihydro-3-hydroxyanthranilate isomerase